MADLGYVLTAKSLSVKVEMRAAIPLVAGFNRLRPYLGGTGCEQCLTTS